MEFKTLKEKIYNISEDYTSMKDIPEIDKNKSFSGIFSFLSNMHQLNPHYIEYENHKLRTSEHLYQMMKFENIEDRNFIANQNSGYESKKTAQLMSNRIRRDWEEIKIDVMYSVLKKKFSIPYYQELLLNTLDLRLIEYNNWKDDFYGVYYEPERDNNNHLGKLLMKLRTEIRCMNKNKQFELF